MIEFSDNHIKELQNTVVTAQLNYEIWWALKEKNNRKEYVDTMNEYPIVFRSLIHAHFIAIVMALYKLYETRKDTVNLPQLLKFIKVNQFLSPKEIELFEKAIQETKPLWVKISILRNNLFGHQSNSKDDEKIWQEAGLKPDQIKELIENSKIILNGITSKWKNARHAFNISATKEITSLLDDLKQIRS